MDIRNLGGRAASSARNEATSQVKGESKASQGAKTEKASDRSSVSSSGNRLRDLSDVARNEPEVRSDAVARGRALIESGDIDSPETLDRAAQAFLG